MTIFLSLGTSSWLSFGVLGLFRVKSSSKLSGFLFFWGVIGGKLFLRCVVFSWLFLGTAGAGGRAIFASWAHITDSGPTVWAAGSASPVSIGRVGAGLHAGI